jgi:hypothetical protein
MQTQVASLLLIVSSVVLASVVVGFATTLTEQTVNVNSNPQIDRIQNLQEKMLNESSSWLDGLPSQSQPLNQTLPATEP